MNRHLYRSRDDRMLAGVAGGLAELWDADPSLVRVVWAVLVVLTGGIALVIYIVMAIVVPEEGDAPWVGTAGAPAGPAGTDAPPAAAPPTAPGTVPAGGPPADWRQTRYESRMRAREARAAWRASHPRDRSGAMFIGILLVLIGAWFLVREYLPTIDWDWFWPLVLVALGVLVLVMAIRPRDDHRDGAGGPGSGGSAGS